MIWILGTWILLCSSTPSSKRNTLSLKKASRLYVSTISFSPNKCISLGIFSPVLALILIQSYSTLLGH